MGRRILAVDDDQLLGWALRIRLWKIGYDVTNVDSAEEAFAALGAERFDLILLDMNMPGIDGLSALEIIVRDRLAPGVPIVFLTASNDIEEIRRARSLGALGHLTKSASGERLATVLDKVFSTPDTVWIDDHHRLAHSEGRPPSAYAQS